MRPSLGPLLEGAEGRKKKDCDSLEKLNLIQRDEFEWTMQAFQA